MSDSLKREWGILLGTMGPLMMERVKCYREIADLVKDEAPKAATYLESQAHRAEETIRTLAKGLENGI